MRVTTATIIPLPWLAPLGASLHEHGCEEIFDRVTAPASSDVFVDDSARQARIRHEDGRIEAWSGFAKLAIDPSEPSWTVTWLVEGSHDEITLGFEPFTGEDDEAGIVTTAQVYADGFEGHECRFAEFMQLLTDPVLNPHGLDLPDGVYSQADSNLRFDVRFGRDGHAPAFRVVPETLPAELDYPYVTVICVHQPLAFESPRHGAVQVEPGFYRSKVTAFKTTTGEVMTIQCKSLDDTPGFKIDGEQLTHYIHEEVVEVVKIIMDRRPNY